MSNPFLEKYNLKEYISSSLYHTTLQNNPEIIPPHFSLTKYNENVVQKDFYKYKYYFQNLFQDVAPNITLNEEQMKAILTDEDYTLIVAGAGTGKTTTLVAKVKYLVEQKHVSPDKILVMSLTRKATMELADRIQIDFHIPANVTTFHSLGFSYLRELYSNRHCYVVDENMKYQIFLSYFKNLVFPNKSKLEDMITLFSNSSPKRWLFGSYFRDNYKNYATFDEYFESYVAYKKQDVQDVKKTVEDIIEKELNQELIYTIRNELVKSKGEAIIANFLYKNNIEYKYEKLYEKFLPNNRPYKPDFTLNIGGEEVYIEYFGLSNYSNNMARYEKIKKMKEDYHAKHHNKFIKIDYTPNEVLEDTLKQELLKFGFVLKPKSYEEIYEDLLRKNQISQFYPFRDLFFYIIDQIKKSPNRESYYSIVMDYIHSQTDEIIKENLKRELDYFHEFYCYYQAQLFGNENYGFDFSDMLYYANKFFTTIPMNSKLNFDYIIIDEYQDISQTRYEFTKKIALKNHSKIVAVGDDWQSIYQFTGSKIEYFYNFTKLFPNAKILKLNQTYRNSRELIKHCGKFIMRNPFQIKKTLFSTKSVPKPIEFVYFDYPFEYQALKELILKIHAQHKDHRILVLARNNRMITECFNDKELQDGINSKIVFVGQEDIDIQGMTFHKSKGLSSDEVILIGLNQYFPSKHFSKYWITRLFEFTPTREPIEYAEERRLFYVALTRTRDKVYLLVNRNESFRSPFINELMNIIHENEN